MPCSGVYGVFPYCSSRAGQLIWDMEHGMQNSIEPNALYIEKVYDRLLEAIISGDLKPGQRVRQAALANRLGVSRQPISHALQLLRYQGFVIDAGKQGVEVAPVDPDYIVHLYRARLPLEASAALMAAQRMKEGVALQEHIDALQECVAQGTNALEQGAPLSVLVKADSRFHMTLYLLSGNLAIAQMMAGQWPHLMRSMMAVLDDPGVPARAWEEHRLITECILSGSIDDAHQTMTKHIERAGRDLGRRLRMRF